MNAQVIVDTSVWIDFFRGSLNAKHKDAFVLLLEAEEVIITDVIKHELLVGAKVQKEFFFLQDCLSALEEFSIEAASKSDFNQFGFDLKTRGLLGKYTDLSIAFLAKIHEVPVYSFDKYFDKLAKANVISLLKI
jgi:predicted nucleic acid-binding protein